MIFAILLRTLLLDNALRIASDAFLAISQGLSSLFVIAHFLIVFGQLTGQTRTLLLPKVEPALLSVAAANLYSNFGQLTAPTPRNVLDVLIGKDVYVR